MSLVDQYLANQATYMKNIQQDEQTSKMLLRIYLSVAAANKKWKEQKKKKIIFFLNEKTKMKIKPTLNSLSTESFLLDNDLISFSKSLLFKLISFIFFIRRIYNVYQIDSVCRIYIVCRICNV
jgi:hypothetical protein